MGMRGLILGVSLLALLLPAGTTATSPQAPPPAREYDNLPLSNTDLERAVHKANLIARARITKYQPPATHNGTGTPEQTTITLEEVYSGHAKTGDSITYNCLCHMVEAPSASDMVGREVISILTHDKHSNSWVPATKISPLFYNFALRDRIKRLLRR
jgi:hypothetical protein